MVVIQRLRRTLSLVKNPNAKPNKLATDYSQYSTEEKLIKLVEGIQ